MNKYVRRAIIGLLAGVTSSVVLAATLDAVVLGSLLGALTGIGYALAFRPVARVRGQRYGRCGAWRAALDGGQRDRAAFGGRQPQWTAEGMLALFPGLVGWLRI